MESNAETRRPCTRQQIREANARKDPLQARLRRESEADDLTQVALPSTPYKMTDAAKLEFGML